MQKEDYRWFLDHYNEIFAQYGVCYVSIKNKTVLGVFASMAEGVRTTAQSEPMGTFIVQYCNGNETGYTNYISSMNFV